MTALLLPSAGLPNKQHFPALMFRNSFQCHRLQNVSRYLITESAKDIAPTGERQSLCIMLHLNHLASQPNTDSASSKYNVSSTGYICNCLNKYLSWLRSTRRFPFALDFGTRICVRKSTGPYDDLNLFPPSHTGFSFLSSFFLFICLRLSHPLKHSSIVF